MTGTPREILRQQDWTEAELRAAGYTYYMRQKQLVMARVLPEAAAPKRIETSWATLEAQAGQVICYRPESEAARASADDFDHWPVQPDIFERDYAAWDEPLAETPALAQLRALGCQPYYKRAGCWARQLDAPALIQSLESPEPAQYPAGAWVCIGTQGEPWGQSDSEFRSRYSVEG